MKGQPAFAGRARHSPRHRMSGSVRALWRCSASRVTHHVRGGQRTARPTRFRGSMRDFIGEISPHCSQTRNAERGNAAARSAVRSGAGRDGRRVRDGEDHVHRESLAFQRVVSLAVSSNANAFNFSVGPMFSARAPAFAPTSAKATAGGQKLRLGRRKTAPGAGALPISTPVFGLNSLCALWVFA